MYRTVEYSNRFCNTGAGWKKGYGERCEYVRCKDLSINTHYISLTDALNHLLSICDKMPQLIQALFNKHFTEKARDFVFLLQYARENNFSDNDIIEAYSSLKSWGSKKYIGKPDQVHDVSYCAVILEPVKHIYQSNWV